MHCANPDCAGRGLKTCNRRQRVRCCGLERQRAHWAEHKLECKAPAATAVPSDETKKDQGESGEESGL